VTIERVFVAGAGLMGHGMAQVFAAAERRVDLYEPELVRAIAGRDRIAVGLERLVAKGRLAAPLRAALLDRIVATDRPEAVGQADLAIEAIPEDLDLKRSLLALLDAHAPGRTILATNTSSIPIGALAEVLAPIRRPRFLGLHIFSPVPVMPLVEVIRGAETDSETVEAIIGLAGERYAPPRVLEELVAEGRLGRKSGRGFHDDQR
jgi:3-hydroxyacyl-CoA dehydrogenase